MDDFDSELKRIIDLPISSSIADDNLSIKELYKIKKETLGISDRQIQKLLDMDAKSLNPILDGNAKQINFINIIKLSYFLGISINELTHMYVPEFTNEQIEEIQRTKEMSYIIEKFDVSALTKLKFFNTNASSKEISSKIINFFGLESLYDYSKNPISPAFSRTKRNSNDLMRYFWVYSAFIQFEKIENPYPYNRSELLELIPKIKPYTRDIKNGLIKVLKALYRAGVTVIFQPNLKNIQIRGATMVVNKKPCIVLSDLQNNYPTLWFVLLHELHHVLYDIKEIGKRTYHLSGEADLFLMDEEKADDFAQNYLLNESRLKYISSYIDAPIMVEKAAKDWGIHPSIIYAIYCYKTNEWSKYSKFIPKMKEAISLLNTHPFEKETLMDSIEQIKKIIYTE